MGMEYLPQYDYYSPQQELNAVMIRLKHTETYATLIELRHSDAQALAQQGLDPITYAVRSKESLEIWKNWLEQNGLQCSPVHAFQSLRGWVLTTVDPDGRIVRIYSDEKHEHTGDADPEDF